MKRLRVVSCSTGLVGKIFLTALLEYLIMVTAILKSFDHFSGTVWNGPSIML